MRMIQLLALGCIIGAMVACDTDAPKANAANCSQAELDRLIAELPTEADRNTLLARCWSFDKARTMRDWEYVPSPTDDF